MVYERLLAKSYRENDMAPTLVEHTRHVCRAFVTMYGTSEQPTEFGRNWLRFFKLDVRSWRAFHKDGLAACCLHDLGKANDGFQDAVHRQGEQAIWHEHLSALLISLKDVRAWLQSAEIDFCVVLSAILTHHLRTSGSKDGIAPFMGKENVQIVNTANGLQETIDYAGSMLGLGPFSVQQIPTWWSHNSSGKNSEAVSKHRKVIQDDLYEFECDLDDSADESRKRILWAVRAALIVADAAGSAFSRTGERVADWFANLPVLSPSDVDAMVINPRVNALQEKGRWEDKCDGLMGWSQFQVDAGELGPRALLIAPCGSGKTLAAWKWIAAQLRGYQARRVLFLYPTRATATEGFRDYVSWAPEAEAALMHGTSAFDLDRMFENPADEGSDPRKSRDYRAQQSMYALGFWNRRLFSATVDQFLSFMSYSHCAICMLPVLAESIIVIDEVHSFDNSMFSALKEFLRSFQAPVLCMTATLLENKRQQLVANCGLQPPPKWPEDLRQVADAPRYRIRRCDSQDEATLIVQDALRQGKRVLWVVNQVRRAQTIARDFFVAPHASPVVCYHSRFRLRDRVERHKEIMQVLSRGPKGAALGVTTQVCEMSLDIDVDLLVTEECPITALVQRMGRCNRKRNPRSLDWSGQIVVYPPLNADYLPYSDDDLLGVKEFVYQLVRRDCVTQTDLDVLLASGPKPPNEGDKYCSFTSSSPYAVKPSHEDGHSFRDITEFTTQCVLDGEIDEFLASDEADKPGFLLPCPHRMASTLSDSDSRRAKLGSYIKIAPSDHYDRLLGLLDTINI